MTTFDRTTAVSLERLPPASALDQLVFEVDDIYAIDQRAQDEARRTLVRAAVGHHLEVNTVYRAFAERCGFDPDTATDLDDIPQIPSTCFKRTDIRSRPLADMAKRCTSSGTMGTLSVVWRDRTTLERLLGSVRRSVQLAGSWLDDELDVVNLGPDADEADDLWIAYVISLAELLYPTTHCVVEGRLDVGLAADAVHDGLADGRSVAIVGPPPLVDAFTASEPCQRLRHDGRRAGDRLRVLTAGGWKTPGGPPRDPEQFRHQIVERLGLAGHEQVRDAFNQVELNTVMAECEHHRLHVPPWLHVTARDPAALDPLPAGQAGLLSYLDPTAESFPCFVIADDFGTVRDDGCPCGRRGRIIRILRRVRRDESWGCALKLSAIATTAAAP